MIYLIIKSFYDAMPESIKTNFLLGLLLAIVVLSLVNLALGKQRK